MVHKVVLKSLLGGPKGQNYFHNNTKIMFGFYAILIFTMMVQNGALTCISQGNKLYSVNHLKLPTDY